MPDTSPKSIVGILLAAGRGERFDATGTQLKLLAPVTPGAQRTLAETAATALRNACTHVVAVVQPTTQPHQTRLHALLLNAGCQLAINPNAHEGLGASVRAGALWVQQHTPGACGCLVALADMPFVSEGTIASIAQAVQEGAPTAAPVFKGQRGHPVGFGAALFAALSTIDAHTGARELLERYPPRLIPVTDRGTVLDIDTPEALGHAHSALGHGDFFL